MQLNEKLRILRTTSGLSQESVATLLDVSRQSVSKWEKGISKPSTNNLLRLSEIFEVSIEDLMNDNLGLSKHYNSTNFFTEFFKQKRIVISICILLIIFIIALAIASYLKSIDFNLTTIYLFSTISGATILTTYLLFKLVVLRYVFTDCKNRGIRPFWYVILSIKLIGLAFYLLRRDEITNYEKR